MRPPASNLLPCLAADGLWHVGNVPMRLRVPEERGHVFLALCGKEAVYAGDDHVATCVRCLRDESTW